MQIQSLKKSKFRKQKFPWNSIKICMSHDIAISHAVCDIKISAIFFTSFSSTTTSSMFSRCKDRSEIGKISIHFSWNKEEGIPSYFYPSRHIVSQYNNNHHILCIMDIEKLLHNSSLPSITLLILVVFFLFLISLRQHVCMFAWMCQYGEGGNIFSDSCLLWLCDFAF